MEASCNYTELTLETPSFDPMLLSCYYPIYHLYIVYPPHIMTKLTQYPSVSIIHLLSHLYIYLKCMENTAI